MNNLDNFLDYCETKLLEDSQNIEQPQNSDNELDPNTGQPVDVSQDGSIQTPQFDNIETLERINAIQSINRLWNLTNKIKYIQNLGSDKEVLELENIIATISDKLDIFSTEDLISFKNETIKIVQKALSKINVKNNQLNENEISILSLLENDFEISVDKNIKEDKNKEDILNNILHITHRFYIETLRSEDSNFDVFDIELNKMEAYKILTLGRNILRYKKEKNNISVDKNRDNYRIPSTLDEVFNVKILNSLPIDISENQNILYIKEIPNNESILQFMAIIYSYYHKDNKLEKLDKNFCENFVKIFLSKVYNISDEIIEKSINYLYNNLHYKQTDLIEVSKNNRYDNNIDSDIYECLLKIEKIKSLILRGLNKNFTILETQTTFFDIYKLSLNKTFKENNTNLDQYLFSTEYSISNSKHRKLLLNLMRIKDII